MFICYECTNGVQTITISGITVTLTADPCFTSLSAAVPAPVNPNIITYDAVTTTSIVGDMSTFVANSDATNCPITSCVLKA